MKELFPTAISYYLICTAGRPQVWLAKYHEVKKGQIWVPIGGTGALNSIRKFNTVSLAESNIPHQIDFLNIFTEQISFFCHNVHGCATASVIGKRSGTEEGAWQIWDPRSISIREYWHHAIES